MGVLSAIGVLCVCACLVVCKGQFHAYSDLSSLSRMLQTLAYGRQTAAPQATSQKSEASPTQQSLTAPANTYNQLLGLLASRWNGMEQQIENRLESLPDRAANAAEQRIDRATDYFENVQEQQLDQSTKNWNNYMSNQWGSTEDKMEETLEQIDNKMENRFDQIETLYGEQAAENAENKWEATQEVIEDTVDAATDLIDNDDDNDDDNNDDTTDDWDLSFDSFDDTDDWSNSQTAWGNDDVDDSWGQYAYLF